MEKVRKMYYAEPEKLEKPADEFQTPDLGLATVLSLDHEIVGLSATMNRNPQIFFNFKKFPGIENVVNQYWNGQLQVEPKSFVSQFKMVKARMNEKINSLN